MDNIIDKTREKLLMTQIGGVTVGCIFCIILSKIIFKGNVDETQLINSKIILFMGLVALYVITYFATLRGFFSKKIKAHKKALHIMYNTDEERIVVKHRGLFGNHIHGEFYKDRVGIIHYIKRPWSFKVDLLNKVNLILENRKFVTVAIGATAILAIILIKR